jgi:hypothetical protein
LSARLSYDGKTVKLSYAKMQGRRGGGGLEVDKVAAVLVEVVLVVATQPQLPATATRLSGIAAEPEWNGTGTDSLEIH